MSYSGKVSSTFVLQFDNTKQFCSYYVDKVILFNGWGYYNAEWLVHFIQQLSCNIKFYVSLKRTVNIPGRLNFKVILLIRARTLKKYL